MNIFSSFLHFLSSIFNKVRPGLDKFLHDEMPAIQAVMSELVKKFEGLPLYQWRDEAFKEVGTVVKGGLDNPGTWITIALNLAYDVEQAIAKPKNATA